MTEDPLKCASSISSYMTTKSTKGTENFDESLAEPNNAIATTNQCTLRGKENTGFDMTEPALKCDMESPNDTGKIIVESLDQPSDSMATEDKCTSSGQSNIGFEMTEPALDYESAKSPKIIIESLDQPSNSTAIEDKSTSRGQQNIGFLVTEDCAPSMSNGMQSSNEEGKESLDQPSDFVSVGDKCTSRYATFIVKHPYILLLLISAMVILCGMFSLISQFGAPPLPDFSDPIKGFEARGTTISDRSRSQINLYYAEQRSEITRVPHKCEIESPISNQQIGDIPAICNKDITFSPGKLTAKLVFATTNGQSLLSAKNLKSICRLENKIIREYYDFDDNCHKANGTQHCCPSWSVGHYIALLYRNASCFSIDELKVKRATTLLKKCFKYYGNGTLKPDCWDFTKNTKISENCNYAPAECTQFNAVYNILHYLTDRHFLSDESNSDSFLQYSIVLVPVKENKHFQADVYKQVLKGSDYVDGDVELSGYELSQLKFKIFNERMLTDLYLAAIAMLIIMVILWLYTSSFLITCLTALIVISSLVIAYFVYTKILGMKFFPFLNILTSVFLVGIAADDAFVYIDIWNQFTLEQREKLKQPPSSKEERDKELIRVTTNTMKHASLSMFVTSFTTSSAFFASLTSEITSIRLFGLYSGFSILCMFFLMVTWFPAAVIIEQTVFSRCNCCSKFQGNATSCIIVDKLKAWHKTFFTDLLPCIVLKLRYFFIVVLSLLAVGGIVVATFKPGLHLPTSQDFQMFHESHALEKYPLKLKKNFRFETIKRSSFPINLIWGIKATDTGDQFNPYDMGTLKWDENFNIASEKSQKWIDAFILQLREQAFFAKGQKLSFIEQFFSHMRMNCTKNNTVCCNDSTFPYNASVFSYCMKRMQCQRLQEFQVSGKSIADGAPFFDTKDRFRFMTLTFDSTVAFTWSYDPADRFWTQTEEWTHEKFKDAPSSMDGWFISELQFYNLQRSLSEGTFISMGISLAIAFAVMLITTGNIYISFLAIITITFALSVTIASLVLIGWELNILESITFSVSVGLSVDFTLHYGVAYVLAVNNNDRKLRVLFSITGMSSAISMAAFTTFIAGSIAAQSNLLSYIQIGHFLMIIMSVSWVYGTFFFQALCCIVGPENDSGQIKLKQVYKKLKWWLCCTKDADVTVNIPMQVKTVGELDK